MLVIPARVKVVVVMVSALALAAGLLTLALLSKPAQAQAETITTQDRSTFTQLSGACGNNELVLIQGTMHTVAHTTTDETGVRHTTFHFNIQGRGESASGAKYVFNHVFTSHDNFTGVAGDNFTLTFTQTVKLIRQGSATPTDDLKSRLLIHVTLNDQGEVTAEVEKAESECT
jgi:hypothetical protein